MSNKTEWEVVDAEVPPQDTRQTLQQLMKSMLGPWWRWKIAGLFVAAGALLIFFLTVSAIFVLGIMAVALLSIGVNKVRQWVRARPGTAIRERHRHGNPPDL
jgi:hypothetical protein